MPNRFGGVGVTLPLNQIGTNGFTLQAGEVMPIPSGYFNIRHGGNTTVQVYDPVTTTWRPCGFDQGNFIQVDSDGNNYRIANQTGCPVAVVLTNAGTGYTSAPTVTAAAGGSTYVAVVGGLVSTSVTVVNGGTNYTYPPLVVFGAPGSPGIPASGYSTISGGAVSTITVTNQGGGYNVAPFISLVNDPRDTTGSGATATCSLTGSQTIAGVLITNHGTAITSGTVPALTFSGGGGSSAAATLIMDWTVTSYAVTAGGAGYNGYVKVETVGAGTPTIAPAYTNPDTQVNLFRGTPAVILGALSSNAVTATGQALVQGGHIASSALGSNNLGVAISGGTASTVATLTLGVGGASDFVFMQAG